MNFPAMPDEMIRAIALQCACQYADEMFEAMSIAETFVDFIEGDTVEITIDLVEF